MAKRDNTAKKETLEAYSPSVIFEFSTEHLLKKDKIRFYYALKGRDGKSGIKKTYNIQTLGRAVLLVSEKHADDIEAFLKQWGCKFKKIKVLIKNE